MATTALAARSGSLAAQPAYVYGVTWAAAARPASDGIGSAEVVPVVHEELAALATSVPTMQVRARRRDLLRHAAILQDAFERNTVVPLRFGTVFASGSEILLEFLEPRRDALVELLTRLEGLVELTVRAFYDEEAVLAEIVRADREVAELRHAAGGRADLRLGEAVAAALAARREADAERIVTGLLGLSRDVLVEERQADLEVLRAAFLVERTALAKFDGRMDELARRRQGVVRFKYTGPLPPHHFVAGQWDS